MFKSILVALDGSGPSNAGFKSALALAGDQDAVLNVLHVIDGSATFIAFEGGYAPPGYSETLYAGLRKSGEAILAKAIAAARAVHIRVEPILVDSRGEGVARAILRSARKVKADLIVIGTHGRRGLARVLMGSDAEQVLREATVPVLLVRSGERTKRRPAPAKRKTEVAGKTAAKAAAA